MNKTLSLSRPLVYLIVLATVLVFGCTRTKHGIYHMMLNHEYGKADLCLKTLDLDGKTVSYLESEAGAENPHIVLIHGFGANKENWVRFSGFLTDGYHVVAVDLPGHGESFKDPELRYDIDDQVAYLHEILGRIGVESFHLAGNSMGGAISCLYAATHPDQVQSLLLIDPGGIYQYESELFRQLKDGKNPLIATSKDEFYDLMDLAMEKKPFIPWPVKSVLAEKAVENQAMLEKVFSDIHITESVHRYVFEDELKKITAPTLILWGTEDRLLAVETADVFERMIPESKKVILEGIGHVPMVEDPKQSAEIYREFLSSL
jgi:abhydrolase domain-containing protein 6